MTSTPEEHICLTSQSKEPSNLTSQPVSHGDMTSQECFDDVDVMSLDDAATLDIENIKPTNSITNSPPLLHSLSSLNTAAALAAPALRQNYHSNNNSEKSRHFNKQDSVKCSSDVTKAPPNDVIVGAELCRDDVIVGAELCDDDVIVGAELCDDDVTMSAASRASDVIVTSGLSERNKAILGDMEAVFNRIVNVLSESLNSDRPIITPLIS